MPGWLRIALGLVLGVVVGIVANMGLVMLGGIVLPPPEGVDPTELESIRANIGTYSPLQFVPPFVAHAVGTLIGAGLATAISRSGSFWPAMIVGGWFLLGGIGMVVLIPETPVWFMAVDLGLAYLPMALLGHRLARTLGRGDAQS
jgi:hypothetical protein